MRVSSSRHAGSPPSRRVPRVHDHLLDRDWDQIGVHTRTRTQHLPRTRRPIHTHPPSCTHPPPHLSQSSTGAERSLHDMPHGLPRHPCAPPHTHTRTHTHGRWIGLGIRCNTYPLISTITTAILTSITTTITILITITTTKHHYNHHSLTLPPAHSHIHTPSPLTPAPWARAVCLVHTVRELAHLAAQETICPRSLAPGEG